MKLCKSYQLVLLKWFDINFFEARVVCYILLVANIFFGGCSIKSFQGRLNSQPKKSYVLPTEEERVWMQKFFKKYFLEGTSIYTLFGTKPISSEMLVLATEEEYRKATLFTLERGGVEGKEKEKWCLSR